MYEVLQNPMFWIFACAAVVPIVGTVAYYASKFHRDRLEAELKMEMIQRGMTADDIVKVLAAGSDNASDDVDAENSSIHS